MEQNPSCEANNRCVNREIPGLQGNRKVYFHIHNSPTLDPNLSHINSVHTLTSYFLKIQLLYTILPSKPRSPKCPLPFRFSN